MSQTLSFTLLPFLIALVLAGFARLLGGPGRGAATGGAAIGIAFLVAVIVQRGWPGLPSLSAPSTLLPYLTLGGLAVGLSASLTGLGRRGGIALTMAFSALAVWLLLGAPTAAGAGLIIRAGLLWLAWVVVLHRLATRPPSEPTAAVMLIMAALGAGLVPLMADQTALGRPALTLAAAAVGFLVWAWFFGLPFLGAATYGGGGTLLALATLTAGASPGRSAAMAVLVMVFFADASGLRLAFGAGLVRKLTAPLGLALAACLPLGLALAVAYVATHMPSP